MGLVSMLYWADMMQGHNTPMHSSSKAQLAFPELLLCMENARMEACSHQDRQGVHGAGSSQQTSTSNRYCA